MRVAFLVSGRPGTPFGGNAYNRHMIAAMRAAGVEVSVHDLADGPVAALLQAMPAEAVPVIDGRAFPAFADAMDDLSARRCVGLIHHAMACETDIAADESARQGDIAGRSLAALPRIIATSDATATRLATEFGVDPARIVVVPAGAEGRPRSIGSGGPGCEILSVGLLTPRKGDDLLMRALARLFDLDWHLTIVGEARDAAYADSLNALAAELGITERVTFAGAVTDGECEALWQRADIFALTTEYEGYGMAVVEALTRGLPVAITSGGAAASLVTPESGVVCEPGDGVTLSKSLRRLIFDTALRQSMANAAWDIGQGLPDWATQARGFLAALD